MQSQRTVEIDPAQAAVNGLALLLGRAGAIEDALLLLVDGLSLRSVVLRDAGGVRASVGLSDVDAVGLDVLVGAAVLTVIGAREENLPLLQVAAAVLDLALRAEDLLLLAEQERDELADDLHDGPVQQVVVARYAADAAVRGGDARVARDAVQDALVTLRRTMWHLRPRSADLGTALEELSQHLTEGGQRALEVTVLPGGDALSPAGTAVAYRFVQTVALAGAVADGPLAVIASRRDGVVVVSLTTTHALPLDRWERRARALGGQLLVEPSRLSLHLPARLPDPKALS